MSKIHDEADAAEDVPLQYLRGGASVDSADSDLERLLSDDGSETSSVDLPPIDGGRGAWTCLLGAWLVEAMIWGFLLAFGVFQRFYSTNPLFSESNNIATIGTLVAGISYLGMPFTNPIALRWPQYRRTMCVAGWALCVFGLVAASFATKVWLLILFQGLTYGVGWVVSYTPQLFILNEWFVERRGLAYGILFGASGASGLVIPVVINRLLDRYGFAIALRAYAVAIVILSGPGLLLVRPRMTPSKHPHTTRQAQSRSALQALRPFATNFHFLIMAAAVFLQGLGFFIPNVFLPSFAEGLGLLSSAGSSLLAWVSHSQVLGQCYQGFISDKVNIYLPLSISALVPGLGALFLWGPAKDMSYLVPFSLLWGFFSASYSVLYTRMCSFLTDQDDSQQKDDEIGMLLYGFFNFERGVALLLEGPMSGFLIEKDHEVNRNQYGLGKYALTIQCTVLFTLISAAVGIGWFWRPGQRLGGLSQP